MGSWGLQAAALTCLHSRRSARRQSMDPCSKCSATIPGRPPPPLQSREPWTPPRNSLPWPVSAAAQALRGRQSHLGRKDRHPEEVSSKPLLSMQKQCHLDCSVWGTYRVIMAIHSTLNRAVSRNSRNGGEECWGCASQRRFSASAGRRNPGSGRMEGERQHCFHKNSRGGREGVRKRLQEIPASAHPPGSIPARLGVHDKENPGRSGHSPPTKQFLLA